MTRAHRWPIARILIGEHSFFLALVWLAAVAITAVVITVVAVVGTVQSSMLDGTGSILRWFALFYGMHLTSAMLPTFVAHGRTRREIFAQTTAFIATTAVLAGTLMTCGYFLESLAYKGFGWPQHVSGDRMFGSADQYPLVFVSYLVLFAVWISVGAFIGAAFYRDVPAGAVSIVLGLGLVSLAGVAVGFDRIPFLFLGKLDTDPLSDLPAVVAVGLCAGAYLLATALHWAFVRNLPLRTKVA